MFFKCGGIIETFAACTTLKVVFSKMQPGDMSQHGRFPTSYMRTQWAREVFVFPMLLHVRGKVQSPTYNFITHLTLIFFIMDLYMLLHLLLCLKLSWTIIASIEFMYLIKGVLVIVLWEIQFFNVIMKGASVFFQVFRVVNSSKHSLQHQLLAFWLGLSLWTYLLLTVDSLEDFTFDFLVLTVFSLLVHSHHRLFPFLCWT